MPNPITYLKDVRTELKLVVWPTKETVTRMTGQVIAISVLVGIFLGALDYVLTRLAQYIIK